MLFRSSLRVMLEAEHSYYELPGKDLEKFTDKLIDRADQEMNLHGEW